MNFDSIPFLSALLAVGIVWMLFALICSMIYDASTSWLSEKGKFMKKQLFNQLHDKANGINWASLVYMHSSVEMLSRSENKPAGEISNATFTKALIDVVSDTHAAKMQQTENTPQRYNNPLLNRLYTAVHQLEPGNLVGMLKAALSNAEAASMNPDNTINEAKLYLALHANIDDWYEGLQKRIGVWYKKKTRQRIFWLALILAIIVNVDSVQLFDLLKGNENTRKAIFSHYENNSTNIERLVEQQRKTDSTLIAQGSATPDNADSDKAKVDTVAMAKTQEKLDSLTFYLKEMDSLAKTAELPVGFSYNLMSEIGKNTGAKPIEKKSVWVWIIYLLTKLIGYLLSAFAGSLGAPFWFDLLKKVLPVKR
ncbi:MAG: hypothetical protein EBX41_03080 [Chitinophagia bacterium]|nr:hypothetical protein [Chitinophagia bacterium]